MRAAKLLTLLIILAQTAVSMNDGGQARTSGLNESQGEIQEFAYKAIDMVFSMKAAAQAEVQRFGPESCDIEHIRAMRNALKAESKAKFPELIDKRTRLGKAASKPIVEAINQVRCEFLKTQFATTGDALKHYNKVQRSFNSSLYQIISNALGEKAYAEGPAGLTDLIGDIGNTIVRVASLEASILGLESSNQKEALRVRDTAESVIKPLANKLTKALPGLNPDRKEAIENLINKIDSTFKTQKFKNLGGIVDFYRDAREKMNLGFHEILSMKEDEESTK